MISEFSKEFLMALPFQNYFRVKLNYVYFYLNKM